VVCVCRQTYKKAHAYATGNTMNKIERILIYANEAERPLKCFRTVSSFISGFVSHGIGCSFTFQVVGSSF